MKMQLVLARLNSYLHEQYPLLVLSSLDQCTRGPSITAMVLANLNYFF